MGLSFKRTASAAHLTAAPNGAGNTPQNGSSPPKRPKLVHDENLASSSVTVDLQAQVRHQTASVPTPTQTIDTFMAEARRSGVAIRLDDSWDQGPD